MSKLTLGQRYFTTLAQRSDLPKYYVGPTLSCYLVTNFHGPKDVRAIEIRLYIYLIRSQTVL